MAQVLIIPDLSDDYEEQVKQEDVGMSDPLEEVFARIEMSNLQHADISEGVAIDNL